MRKFAIANRFRRFGNLVRGIQLLPSDTGPGFTAQGCELNCSASAGLNPELVRASQVEICNEIPPTASKGLFNETSANAPDRADQHSGLSAKRTIREPHPLRHVPEPCTGHRSSGMFFPFRFEAVCWVPSLDIFSSTYCRCSFR